MIRTKILRDIIDSKIEFKNFQEIIYYLYSFEIPKLNYIPIAFCPDNNYGPLVYTSMISILISKEYYTYIIFFIIIPHDFEKKNILLSESLYEQFEYFNITYIKMDNRYQNAFTASYFTISAFYRFSLGELIPDLNKIIYMDADTICLTDLANLYNLNFKGKIILGQVLSTNRSFRTGYYSINSGILLLDLRAMRKIEMEKKVLRIINNRRKILDQSIINEYFFKYIGLFPPKYNAYSLDYRRVVQFNNRSGNLYNNDYLYFSFIHPSIRHFIGPKGDLFTKKEWAYFARQSKYFNKLTKNFCDIYNYSSKYFK